MASAVNGLRQVVSDGTILGDIGAERLRLRRSAVVIGDVTCQSLSVDPDVSISGQVNVHKDAPARLRVDGDHASEDDMDEPRDSGEHDQSRAHGKEPRDRERNHKSSGESKKKGGGSKKESGGGSDRDRREKDDGGKEDAHRKKAKDGGDSQSSKSKSTSKH